jgi:Fe-S-cluster formation regulator IscX/YfhJ
MKDNYNVSIKLRCIVCGMEDWDDDYQANNEFIQVLTL